MALNMKRVTDLQEKTEVLDEDLFAVGNNGTPSLRKTKWSTIWNKVVEKFRTTLLVQNATTADTTRAASAAVAKDLQDQITQQNTKISDGGEGYVRLPDGTMIQHGFFAGSLVTNSNKNATRVITFPYEFSKTGFVSVVLTPDTSSYQNGIMFDSLTYTGFRAILMGALAASTSYPSGFRWIAIGRWK